MAVLAALALAGALVRPSAAASHAQGSVLLTLTEQPGAAAALHLLAGSPVRREHRMARLAALDALSPGATHRDAALHWAHDHGLQVLRADDWSVSLAGPQTTLMRLFGTGVPGLSVPTALGNDVSAVHGLDDRPVMRSHAVPFGLTSAGIRGRYGVPAPGWTGAGVTVGTLNLTGWDPNDLNGYASAAGLSLAPGQVTTVPVDNPPNPLAADGSGGDFEVAMDAEAVLAAAPAAKQRMYFAPNNGVGTVDVFNQMAADGAAGLLQVASTSWGLCEPLSPAWYRDAIAQAVDRMLAAGVTLYAAAGDAGRYDCSTTTAVDNTSAVDFPASLPEAVAVGGTRADQDESAWGQVAANPGTAYAGSGGGGGPSSTYPRPAWQASVGVPGTTRLVPDVSSDADPSTGLGVLNRGAWRLGGGTSLAAPTWAGMTAAALSAAGRTTGLGDVHAVLYAHAAAFHDITTGSNGYDAGPGYDLATGLGVPAWAALGPLLTGAAPAAVTPPTSTASAALLTGTDSRVLFTWSGQDPVPGPGISTYDVSVNQFGGGQVWGMTTAATSTVLPLVPGRAYTLTVRARDAAGNVGLPATARVVVPFDDVVFAHRGAWARAVWGADYGRSHLASGTRGSTLTVGVTGRSVALGLVCAPTGGYVDIYADGRRVARLDTWAPTTRPRQQVTIAAWPTTGRHTLRLVVLGAHRRGARGTLARIDSLTVTPW